MLDDMHLAEEAEGSMKRSDHNSRVEEDLGDSWDHLQGIA